MSSGSYPMRKNQESHCEFCAEFVGSSENEFVARYGDCLADRLLFGDRHFRILPSLGQIVEGHLLIIPVEHYCALADLPASSLAELDNLCRYTRLVLAQTYGSCIFFEHGVRGDASGGCGIDHAHMHAVPVRADSLANTLSREFGGRDISSIAEIRQRLAADSSYLYLEDASKKRHVFPVESLPSQYMRKLVGQAVGKSDWDWRKSGYEVELVSTIQRLSPLFSPAGVGYKE